MTDPETFILHFSRTQEFLVGFEIEELYTELWLYI